MGLLIILLLSLAIGHLWGKIFKTGFDESKYKRIIENLEKENYQKAIENQSLMMVIEKCEEYFGNSAILAFGKEVENEIKNGKTKIN